MPRTPPIVGLLIVGLLVTLAFPVPRAWALFPTAIIQQEQSTAKTASPLRTYQRKSRRVVQTMPKAIDARLVQQKNTPPVSRVSQRIRRSTLESQIEKRQNALDRRTKRLERQSNQQHVQDPAELKRQILEHVNEERAKEHQSPLTWNGALAASAQAYAEDMNARNFFSHTSPEGETPQQRMEKEGYATLTAQTCNCKTYRASFGENLAKGQVSVDAVMKDWMASAHHRDNILSPYFTELGVGISGEYWVQHFGSIDIDPR